jgi:hypothetical protein
MKRLVYLTATLLILAGCSVMKPTEREVTTLFLDYRPYAEQGFFLSSDPYPDAFTSLGEIQIEVLPAMVPKRAVVRKEQKYSDGAYGSNGYSQLVPEEISGSDLLDIAVDKAKELGADGIANLKIRYVKQDFVPVKGGTIDSSYWEITGLCIRR